MDSLLVSAALVLTGGGRRIHVIPTSTSRPLHDVSDDVCGQRQAAPPAVSLVLGTDAAVT